MKLTIEITRDPRGRTIGLASLDWPEFDELIAEAVAAQLAKDGIGDGWRQHLGEVAESPTDNGRPTADAQYVIRAAVRDGQLTHWLGETTSPDDAVLGLLDRLTGGAHLIEEAPNDSGQLRYRCGPTAR